MTELESIISATCITSVEMIDDPTKDFDLEGKHFRLFLAPAAESEVKVGDVVIMKGILPYGDDPVDVPIAVGSWSPVIFEAKVGDVVIVSGILQYSDGDFVDVPVVVGNWSPVLFKEVKFDESLEGLDAYVAPLKYYQVL